MRLFLGIGLPSTLAQELARSIRALLSQHAPTARPGYVFPEDLHVTLSFLGAVPPERVQSILASLATLAPPPLQLELDGIGAFPGAGVLYARVQSSRDLLSLAEQVFLCMEACGFSREARPYTPHVTLARVRSLPHLAPDASNNPAFRQTFQASVIHLYQSLSNGERPGYAVLHSFPKRDSPTTEPHHNP
jgi:2'-5' RNA ligase